MSPANRAGIGTCRSVNCTDPVVVASSGPKPSATLHEERRHAAKHDSTMLDVASVTVKQFGGVPTWSARNRVGGTPGNGAQWAEEKADSSLFYAGCK
jgi:hypothetical protein